MVDGVEVGSSECFKHAPPSDNPDESVNFTEHSQSFSGANMIVIDGWDSVERADKTKLFPIYAIYGNSKVVHAVASEIIISSYYSLWKEKLILAQRKPYILSGDLCLFKMCEENLKRVEESRKCDNCFCWHKYCHAECCKMFIVKKPNADLSGKYLIIHTSLSASEIWYYKLRNCGYARGLLKIPTKYCVQQGPIIVVHKDCDLLDGVLCKGHPNKKPKICKDLNEENIKTMGVYVTPNCLYKYKNMEGTKT